MNWKQYPKYNKSGIEWLGNIPEGWGVKRIKYLGKSIIGLTYDPNEIVDNESIGILLLRASNIQNDKLVLDDCVYIDKTRYIDEKYITKSGDILICSRSGSRDLIGKNVCIDERGIGCTFGVFMTIIRSTYWPFLSKVLKSEIFQAQSSLYITSTINQLTLNTLNNFVVPLPKDRDEQLHIYNFLDCETARIDSLITKKERQIELLQEKRAALISHAVTKGLDPNVPMKDSGVEWLGEIPEHWEILPFTKYIEEKADYRGATPEKVDEGVFLVTAKNVKMGYIDYEFSQEYVKKEDYNKIMRRGMPRLDDILFTTEAPLGNVALVDREDIALAQRIIRFRMSSRFSSNFALYSMMAEYFQFQLNCLSTGSTAEGLKASKLNFLWIITPPFDEQLKISQFIRKISGRDENLIKKIRDSIIKMKEYRTALISAAVTGKIDVREYGKGEEAE